MKEFGDDRHHDDALGDFQFHDNGWLGRWPLSDGDWCDLFTALGEGEDWWTEPPASEGLARLLEGARELDRVKETALKAIRRFRTDTLGFNEGPPADEWTVLGLTADADRELWISLHEYVTDEYSAWWARIRDGQAVEVRRGTAGTGCRPPAPR